MEGYQLGPRAKTDFDGMRRRYHRQPDAGQARHRRVNWGDTTTDGNGNSSGPCGCCNCLDCIDLCTVNAVDVVTECDACANGAVAKYSIDIGGDVGTVTVEYSSGCNWEKDVSVGEGVYRVTLLQAGLSSRVRVTFASGTDAYNLGYRQAEWKPDPDKQWSCLCASVMVPAVAGERFPRSSGFNCSVCVIPVTTHTGTTCEFSTCLEECYAMEWNGPDVDTLLPFGATWIDDPSVVQMLTFSGPVGVAGRCTWFSEERTLSQDGFGTTAQVVMKFRYRNADTSESFVSATYNSTSWSCADGGSLSVVAMTSSAWPSSLSVSNPGDCTFGYGHHDYGYGCGYGVFGDAPADCGDSCYWIGIATGDPLNPAAWSQTGGTGIDFCANCGGCPEPAMIPEVGLTAQTFCNGV